MVPCVGRRIERKTLRRLRGPQGDGIDPGLRRPLVYWHALLSAKTGDPVRERFDCVLVDEYQDTNILQAEILRHLRPEGKGLTVVGDDAQSIYSFRAATVRNILDFPRQYPEATVVTLEQNYRSMQPILDATNAGDRPGRREGYRKNLSERTAGQRPVLVSLRRRKRSDGFRLRQISSIAKRASKLGGRRCSSGLASQPAMEAELAGGTSPFTSTAA